MHNDVKRRLLTSITKLIANNVEDEEDLGNIYDLVSRYIGITNKAEKSSVVLFNNLKRSKRRLISIDFDGVLHQYIKGTYHGDSTVISNPPVEGALEWLDGIVNDGRFFVVIYSSRSKILGFEESLSKWFLDNGMKKETINKIAITATKPPAFVFIDDRNWRFNGKFPSADAILSFKAWHEENNGENRE
jgi:hypothetical protein